MSRRLLPIALVAVIAACGAQSARAPETTTTTTVPTVITDTSYSDSDTSIKILTGTIGTGEKLVTFYVADVRTTAVDPVRTADSGHLASRQTLEPSVMAKKLGAILAVNGDFYDYRPTGVVIKGGVLMNDVPKRTLVAFYPSGDVQVHNEQLISAAELVASGVTGTVSFGPALLQNGEILPGIDVYEVDPGKSIQGRHPRTGMCMVEPGHYLFIVVDGRQPGYSAGIGLIDFAKLFQDRGCQTAYNFDGGGSSVMVFNGRVVNRPSDKSGERPVSDVVYILP